MSSQIQPDNHMKLTEEDFFLWLVEHQSDVEEALSDLSERYTRLLERVELTNEDPMADFLRDYIFTDVA